MAVGCPSSFTSPANYDAILLPASSFRFMVREMWGAVASGRAVRRELFEEADI